LAATSLLPVVGLCCNLQSLADTFFDLYIVVHPRFALGISVMALTVSEISVFPVSAVISGCQSLLESPTDALFKLAVVEGLRFAVEILMISVILSET